MVVTKSIEQILNVLQKFRKKLFYFREEQEIQFASLEVESDIYHIF